MRLVVALAVLALSYPWLVPIVHDVNEILNDRKAQTVFAKRRKKQRKPASSAAINAEPISPVTRYVALGSSFAAGPGIGETVLNSVGRAQGMQSYPCQLANKLGLNPSLFVNAASSGEKLASVASTQLKYVQPSTKLVTITAGGNDVDYTRDMMISSVRQQLRSAVTRAVWRWLQPLATVAARDFAAVGQHFDEICAQIRAIAPNAVIVIATYITVLPAAERLLPLTNEDCSTLREVAEQLRITTCAAAQRNQCLLVDLAQLSYHHDALAPKPWSTGFRDLVPVHPNLAGHTAAANLIYQKLAEHGQLASLRDLVTSDG